MTDDDYVEDPWGAPARLGSAWTSQATFQNAFVCRAPPNKRPKTRGGVKPGAPAVVYVAGVDGMVKVGITGDPATRAKKIGAAMVLTVPVHWAAAGEVETVALSYLGRSDLQPSEWVRSTVADAKGAVYRAWEAVSRYKHVDPALTPDEARTLRIGLAGKSQV